MMTFLRNWDFSRIFKLIAGTVGLILAINYNWFLIGLLAGMFLFQAITNTGCGVCNTSQCTVNNTDDKSE